MRKLATKRIIHTTIANRRIAQCLTYLFGFFCEQNPKKLSLGARGYLAEAVLAWFNLVQPSLYLAASRLQVSTPPQV